MKSLFFSIIIVFFSAVIFVSFILDREEQESGDKAPGFWNRLWVVFLLAFLILLPFIIGTGFYFLVVKGTSLYFHRLLSFQDNSTIINTSLWIVITLFLCEYFFHPIINGLSLMLFKKEQPYFISFAQIIFDSFLIYLLLNIIPGVTIESYSIAFILSLGLFIIDSFIEMGSSLFSRKVKKGIKNEGNH